MLDMLFSGCAAIARGVKMLTDILKYVIHLNYTFVTTVVEIMAYIIISTINISSQLKQLILLIVTNTLDFFHDIFMIITRNLATLWDFVTALYIFLQLCYANVLSVCLACANYASTCWCVVTHTVVGVYDFLAVSLTLSASLFVTAVSTFLVIVTSLGNYSVCFITGVWQGLGFVLSSVASFPTYCVQSLKNIWCKSIEFVTSFVTMTTKETFLGILVMCLFYLTLSNTFRYLFSKGIPLFQSRIRSRRHQENWQFDRGFESDFEDMYGSDTEDVSWVMPTETQNNDSYDADDADGDLHDHNVTDVDDDSDSVVLLTEESDSDASINSQTFSTESSDHEIEVQLPPIDKRVNLCYRSSTPSRTVKTVSSPEEFDREMERERDKRKCVICQDQIKSVLVLPCKHMCMCVLCAEQIVRSRTIGRRVCPLCRTKITKVMNIYV